MMLVLVGIGLWDEKDISLRGIEEARSSDIVYLENYTQPVLGLSLENLKSLVGKEITVLKRGDLEPGMEKIVEQARNKKVCVLVGGDPFVATTHNVFIILCAKMGVELRVVHSSSIFTAVCKTGLEIYRFGRTVTIPFSYGSYKPTGFFKHIKENLKHNLHTLVLLDIDKENNRFMHAKEGIERIVELDKEAMIKNLVVLSGVGSEREKISFGTPKKLLEADLGEPPFSIVIPGKLSEVEEGCLNVFKVG